MKGQEELIGMNGVFKKRRIGNANKNDITSSSEDEQFEDALSSPQSLCQRYLGNEVVTETKKIKEIRNADKDNINENKKRVVATQGDRVDSDNE
ncbi:hypothetical protein RhiirA5_420050 [Rhizophagus irregularis]|uniref:Uncharacterized protein n=1 Tax=Rhizophagus irregularis TaxID=588596 RepID=A0A2N0PGZ1_9GLOM|nr:hypothetical protein RhiirA5_420050 [Rhizophagus irregularis]PKC63294.1 hypothetical protein RhiirA1_463973 [Rhizophagus irregularis]PKK70648.1 hypothetical protein RhiirC2_779429 [Rhizophagus irregularis]